MSLYFPNLYEINARDMGHQQRVSWHNRISARPVDTSEQKVAIKQGGLIALASNPGLGLCSSTQTVYPVVPKRKCGVP